MEFKLKFTEGFYLQNGLMYLRMKSKAIKIGLKHYYPNNKYEHNRKASEYAEAVEAVITFKLKDEPADEPVEEPKDIISDVSYDEEFSDDEQDKMDEAELNAEKEAREKAGENFY